MSDDSSRVTQFIAENEFELLQELWSLHPGNPAVRDQPHGPQLGAVSSLVGPDPESGFAQTVVRLQHGREVTARNLVFPHLSPGDQVVVYDWENASSLSDQGWLLPGIGVGAGTMLPPASRLSDFLQLFPNLPPDVSAWLRSIFTRPMSQAEWQSIAAQLIQYECPSAQWIGLSLRAKITYGALILLSPADRRFLRQGEMGLLDSYDWQAVWSPAYQKHDPPPLVMIADPSIRPVVLAPPLDVLRLTKTEGGELPHPGLTLLALRELCRYQLSVKAIQSVTANGQQVIDFYGLRTAATVSGSSLDSLSGEHPPSRCEAVGLMCRESGYFEVRQPEGITTAATQDRILIQLSETSANHAVIYRPRIDGFAIGDVVSGRVIGTNNAGLLVDIGVPAVLPQSDLSVNPSHLPFYLGFEIQAVVAKISTETEVTIFLQRRSLRKKWFAQAADPDSPNYLIGKTVKGRVININSYAFFVDLGVVTALLHFNEICWGHAPARLNDIAKVGDDIETMVLSIDVAREKVSLSRKQLLPNPWLHAADRYEVGSRYKGRVIGIIPYGAFVQLEEGIEGLLHKNEMSWTQVNLPEDIVALGDEIEVVVLTLKPTEGLISFGLKQTQPDPWSTIQERYPPGSVVEGTITNVKKYGAFVKIEEGVEGLLHSTELTWRRDEPDAGRIVAVNQKIRCQVLDVDVKLRRIALGLRQLSPNPWQSDMLATYPKGKLVKGKVNKVVNFGVFVEILPDLHGLMHMSELPNELGLAKPLTDFITPGVLGLYQIVDVNPQEREVRLTQKGVAPALRAVLSPELVGPLEPAPYALPKEMSAAERVQEHQARGADDDLIANAYWKWAIAVADIRTIELAAAVIEFVGQLALAWDLHYIAEGILLNRGSQLASIASAQIFRLGLQLDPTRSSRVMMDLARMPADARKSVESSVTYHASRSEPIGALIKAYHAWWEQTPDSGRSEFALALLNALNAPIVDLARITGIDRDKLSDEKLAALISQAGESITAEDLLSLLSDKLGPSCDIRQAQSLQRDQLHSELAKFSKDSITAGLREFCKRAPGAGRYLTSALISEKIGEIGHAEFFYSHVRKYDKHNLFAAQALERIKSQKKSNTTPTKP